MAKFNLTKEHAGDLRKRYETLRTRRDTGAMLLILAEMIRRGALTRQTLPDGRGLIREGPNKAELAKWDGDSPWTL
jgi:hypothetical protein